MFATEAQLDLSVSEQPRNMHFSGTSGEETRGRGRATTGGSATLLANRAVYVAPMTLRWWTGAMPCLLALELACVISNPGFDPPAGSTEFGASTGSGAEMTSTASASSTSKGSTSSISSTTDGTSGTDGGSVSSGVTGGVETDSSSGSSSSSSSSSSTSDGTTGEDVTTTTTTGGPGSITIYADIATCVLVANGVYPYAGPGECEQKANAENGVLGAILHDTSLMAQGGGNRRAPNYFRFLIPDDLAGKTLTAVEFTVRTTDNVNAGGFIGDLWQSKPFDLNTLASDIPASIKKLVDGGQAIGASQDYTWTLDPSLPVSGEYLHLYHEPLNDLGALYWDETAANAAFRPHMVIDYE